MAGTIDWRSLMLFLSVLQVLFHHQVHSECTSHDSPISCPAGEEPVPCDAASKVEPACQKCPPNTYSDTHTQQGTRCPTKTSCDDDNMITKSEGSAMEDRTCGCTIGYEMSSYVHKCTSNGAYTYKKDAMVRLPVGDVGEDKPSKPADEEPSKPDQPEDNGMDDDSESGPPVMSDSTITESMPTYVLVICGIAFFAYVMGY